MPAQTRTNVPKEKKQKTSHQSSAATPKSSINDEYNATVAINKELTAGLINQKPKKMNFTHLDEEADERASIQQYSQSAKDHAIDPDQLESGDEDSQPLEQNNGKALLKEDTEEEESDEEESFDPTAFNGRCIQKRGRSIAFGRDPQFKLGPWESLPNTNKNSMAFTISEAAVAYSKAKKTNRDQIGYFIHRTLDNLLTEDLRQFDQITCLIQHSASENKSGNYVWQTFPKEQYVCPTTFGTFQDKYMTSFQSVDYKQQQLLVLVTALHRISAGQTDPSIERVIVRLTDNKLKIAKITDKSCLLVTGSVLIKRPLYTSLFDVLVCWSKPQPLKEIIDSDKYTQYMIPSKFINAVVAEFGLTDIHKEQVDLRYMGLESSGEKDQYTYERNDFRKISDRFNEFVRFILDLYESQNWAQPILIENVRGRTMSDPKVQLMFVKELFTLARVNVEFNEDSYQIVTLESVSANEYFGESFCKDRDSVLYGAATGGYNGFVSVYLRHITTGKIYQFLNNAQYTKPWVNYERLDDLAAKDVHFASLQIFNTRFNNLVDWDTDSKNMKKSEFESSVQQKKQFYNLTYAFMLQQLQFMDLSYGLGHLLRVRLAPFVEPVGQERMKICAANLDPAFFKDEYRATLISFMNTSAMTSDLTAFVAPVLTRDNNTRKAQLMTLLSSQEIYDGPFKKIQLASFSRKFHWIQNFRVMATYRNLTIAARTTEAITHTFSFFPKQCSERIQKDYKNVYEIFTYAERVKKQLLGGDEEVKEPEAKRQARTEQDK